MRKIVIGLLVVLFLIIIFALWQMFPLSKEPGYRFVLSWGESGSGIGEFKEPIGIEISGNEVFVSEGGNNRIQVFDLTGNFLRTFGYEGDKPGELARPMLMDINDNKLYVAEYLNDRVQIFSLEGEPLGAIGSSGTGSGEFDSPSGVAVDKDGKIYVADFFNHRIQVLDPGGNFIKQIGITGKIGIRAGLFNYPTDVTLSPDGNLVVADAYNDRIQVFAPDGSFIRKWGGPFALNIHGPFRGWFMTATAVHTDLEGNVYVADFYNNRIQKFSSKGEFLVDVSLKNSELEQLQYPTDVALDSEGNIYVVDFGNNRIVKFAPTGHGPDFIGRDDRNRILIRISHWLPV